MDTNKNVIRQNSVLIIEDDVQLADLFTTYIKSADYEVDLLFSGNDALEKIKENQYDLIFLDINMPGKTGFEVLKELKADTFTAKIPVIMLTNMGEMNNIQKALDMGAADYAIKMNMNKEKIKTLVNKHLISHNARSHDIFTG